MITELKRGLNPDCAGRAIQKKLVLRREIILHSDIKNNVMLRCLIGSLIVTPLLQIVLAFMEV
jgi:hypothetical protein